MFVPLHKQVGRFLVEIGNFTSFEVAFSGFASCRVVLGNAPTVVAVAAAISAVVAKYLRCFDVKAYQAFVRDT